MMAVSPLSLFTTLARTQMQLHNVAQDLFDDFPQREVEFGTTAHWEDLSDNPTAEVGFSYEIDYTIDGKDRLLSFSFSFDNGHWCIYATQVSIPDYEEIAEYSDLRLETLEEALAALPMQISAFGHACQKAIESGQ